VSTDERAEYDRGGWQFHVDLAWFILGAVVLAYYLGWLGFRWTVVLMLWMGLPYGGPP